MGTDTIAAIATAMTSSGIGIVRISGDEAVSITDRIFEMKNQKKLSVFGMLFKSMVVTWNISPAPSQSLPVMSGV